MEHKNENIDEILKKIEASAVTVSIKTGENGKVFGSVSSREEETGSRKRELFREVVIRKTFSGETVCRGCGSSCGGGSSGRVHLWLRTY